MKPHINEAFVEKDKPDTAMYVVSVDDTHVHFAYKPNGTSAVLCKLEDLPIFWAAAKTYHKKRHPWRNQDFRKRS